VYKECPSCSGSGLVKSAESMAIEVVRKLIMAAQQPNVARISVTVEEEVAMYINNRKRRELTRLEDEHNVQVHVISREDLSPEFLKFEATDSNGRDVRVDDI
jgi:ribonuclease E